MLGHHAVSAAPLSTLESGITLLIGSQPVFAKVQEQLIGAVPACGKVQEQLIGVVPACGKVQEQLIGAVPACGKVQEQLIGVVPAFGGGAVSIQANQVGFLAGFIMPIGSLPSHIEVREQLIASVAAIGLGKVVLLSSQQVIMLASLLMSNAQAAFVRGQADLPITANPVAQRYQPMHLIEVTV